MLIIGLHPVGQVPDRALRVMKLAPQFVAKSYRLKGNCKPSLRYFSYILEVFSYIFPLLFRRGVVVSTAMNTQIVQRKCAGVQSDLETDEYSTIYTKRGR